MGHKKHKGKKKKAKRARRERKEVDDHTATILAQQLFVLRSENWDQVDYHVTADFFQARLYQGKDHKSSINFVLDIPRLQPHKQALAKWSEKLAVFFEDLPIPPGGGPPPGKHLKEYVVKKIKEEAFELVNLIWMCKDTLEGIFGLSMEAFTAHESPVRYLAQAGFLLEILAPLIGYDEELQRACRRFITDKQLNHHFLNQIGKRDGDVDHRSLDVVQAWVLAFQMFNRSCPVFQKQYYLAVRLSVGNSLVNQSSVLPASVEIGPVAVKHAHRFLVSMTTKRGECDPMIQDNRSSEMKIPSDMENRLSSFCVAARKSTDHTSPQTAQAKEHEEEIESCSAVQTGGRSAKEQSHIESDDLTGSEDAIVCSTAEKEARSPRSQFVEVAPKPPELQQANTEAQPEQDLLEEIANLNLDLEDEQEDTSETYLEEAHLPDDHYRWVFSNRRHYETWTTLFPRAGERDRAGDLTWTAFCNAIGGKPLFFQQINRDQGGAARTFVRTAQDGLPRMSFTFHKPHTKDHIERSIVRNWRTQLKQRFGWEAEDFEFQETTPLGTPRMR